MVAGGKKIGSQAKNMDASESNLPDDYSDEQFESMSGSVSISKSSKIAKVAKVVAGAKKFSNYSPIKEKVDEYAIEESKDSSTVTKNKNTIDMSGSSHNYTDSRSKSGQKKRAVIESSGDSSLGLSGAGLK